MEAEANPRGQLATEIKRVMLSDVVEETVFDSMKPNTQVLLETTPVPRHAYIILEHPVVNTTPDDKGVYRRYITTTLSTINISAQPDQRYTLDDQVINRNFKIICYGNFPSKDSTQLADQKAYKMHNSPDNGNAFDLMMAHCLKFLGRDASHLEDMSKLGEAIDQANRERDDALAELAALKGIENGSESPLSEAVKRGPGRPRKEEALNERHGAVERDGEKATPARSARAEHAEKAKASNGGSPGVPAQGKADSGREE